MSDWPILIASSATPRLSSAPRVTALPRITSLTFNGGNEEVLRYEREMCLQRRVATFFSDRVSLVVPLVHYRLGHTPGDEACGHRLACPEHDRLLQHSARLVGKASGQVQGLVPSFQRQGFKQPEAAHEFLAVCYLERVGATALERNGLAGGDSD